MNSVLDVILYKRTERQAQDLHPPTVKFGFDNGELLIIGSFNPICLEWRPFGEFRWDVVRSDDYLFRLEGHPNFISKFVEMDSIGHQWTSSSGIPLQDRVGELYINAREPESENDSQPECLDNQFLTPFPNLSYVGINGFTLTSEHLIFISNLSKLRILSLTQNAWDAETIYPLAWPDSLKEIYADTTATPALIRSLKRSSAVQVHFFDDDNTEPFHEEIFELPNLKKLVLGDQPLSVEVAKKIVQNGRLRRLNAVIREGNREAIEILWEGCRLTSLDLAAGIEGLSFECGTNVCNSIYDLNLTGFSMSTEFLSSLTSMTKLKHFAADISSNCEELAAALNKKTLKSLKIHGSSEESNLFQKLDPMVSLQELTIFEVVDVTSLTNRLLFPNLEHLGIYCDTISDEDIAQIIQCHSVINLNVMAKRASTLTAEAICLSNTIQKFSCVRESFSTDDFHKILSNRSLREIFCIMNEDRLPLLRGTDLESISMFPNAQISGYYDVLKTLPNLKYVASYFRGSPPYFAYDEEMLYSLEHIRIYMSASNFNKQ